MPIKKKLTPRDTRQVLAKKLKMLHKYQTNPNKRSPVSEIRSTPENAEFHAEELDVFAAELKSAVTMYFWTAPAASTLDGVGTIH